MTVRKPLFLDQGRPREFTTGDTLPSALARVIDLPSIIISGSITVGVLSGPIKKTVPCAGALTTDSIILTPTSSVPAGYLIGHASCLTPDVIELSLYIPSVTLLTSYSIPCMVRALR